jgi:hypothetical protein
MHGAAGGYVAELAFREFGYELFLLPTGDVDGEEIERGVGETRALALTGVLSSGCFQRRGLSNSDKTTEPQTFDLHYFVRNLRPGLAQYAPVAGSGTCMRLLLQLLTM